MKAVLRRATEFELVGEATLIEEMPQQSTTSTQPSDEHRHQRARAAGAR